MKHGRRVDQAGDRGGAHDGGSLAAPGRRTLTDSLTRGVSADQVVQRVLEQLGGEDSRDQAPVEGQAGMAPGPESSSELYLIAHEANAAGPDDEVAQRGFSGASRSLPHLGGMNRAFGENLGDVRAHTGPEAAAACAQLDAQAYAYGSSIAFADPDPTVEVVAHEVAHVIQQRGGSSEVARLTTSDSDHDAQEAEAHEAASQVAAGGEVRVPLTPAGRRVSRLRRFGQAQYAPMRATPMLGGWDQSRVRPSPSDPAGGGETTPEFQFRTVPLHGRTVDEWNQILSGEETTPSHIERHCFPLRALGRPTPDETFRFGHHDHYRLLDITGEPSEEEKVALARALLHGNQRTVRGPGLLVPDRQVSVPFITGSGEDLLPEFLSRYTGHAIEARSRGGREMREADVDGVARFSEQSEALDQSGNNAATLGSALGTACRRATEYLVSYMPGQQPADQTPRYDALNVVHNSAATMQGVLNGIDSFNQQLAEQAQQAWNLATAAVNVAAAASLATVTRALISSFFSISRSYFVSLAQQREPSMSRDTIIGDFRSTVASFGREHQIEPTHYNSVVTQFESGLNNHRA